MRCTVVVGVADGVGIYVAVATAAAQTRPAAGHVLAAEQRQPVGSSNYNDEHVDNKHGTAAAAAVRPDHNRVYRVFEGRRQWGRNRTAPEQQRRQGNPSGLGQKGNTEAVKASLVPTAAYDVVLAAAGPPGCGCGQ